MLEPTTVSSVIDVESYDNRFYARCMHVRVHACSRAQDVGRRYHSCRSPCRRRRDASTLLSLKGSEQTPARRDEEDRDCREKRERAGAGARRSERGEGNERYSRVKIKGK